MRWKILPGEDIWQIARLMFPKDSLARDKLIHAIIHTNPEHFPGRVYQPLPTGAIIHIPDLRTINTYSSSFEGTRKSHAINHLTRRKPQSPSETILSNLNSNHELLLLADQLEQIAANEARARFVDKTR